MASIYICYTSDARITSTCQRTTARLKRLLNRQGLEIVGKTNGSNLVYTISSTTLTTNKAIANIVPHFVMRRS